MFVFVLFEKNTENEVCVRERHFHWWARDREVAREPESRCRALLPCPMAHARRHARAVSRACATAARTAKSFRALKLGAEKRCGAFSAPPQQVRSSPTRTRKRCSETSTTSPSPCSRWCGRPTLALTALSLLGRRVRRLLLAIPKNDARDRRSARHTAGLQPSELGEARVPRC